MTTKQVSLRGAQRRSNLAPIEEEAMAEPGPRNLITDVPGLLVGQAEDAGAITGTTVLIAERPAVAAVDVRGGAPGSRETELLDPAALVERVDAIVLSGGSAFGLDAAAGVMDWLDEDGRGFEGRGLRGALRPAALPDAPLDPEDFSACAGPAAGANTTIAIVATNAPLTKAGCRRFAIMAQDGLARAIRPAHTPFDGDTVFALSTGFALSNGDGA